MCVLLGIKNTMIKRTSMKVSMSAHRTFKELARQFEVGDREMNLIELFDKLASKKGELLKLLQK